MKRTKIVCTIGPASESRTKIEQMAKAGLNVARLNFSHGTYKHHQMLIDNIRSAAKKLNQPIGILQDLQGPRIRTGNIAKEGLELAKGQKIYLVPENFKIALKDVSTFIPIQCPDLYRYLKPKNPILIDDAKIELEVLAIKNKAIECKVKVGDVINSHKGMNFPKSEIKAPALTEKDLKDLEFGIKQNVDFVALSFVSSEKDIIQLRKIIAKLESRHKKKSKNYKKPKRRVVGPWTQTKIVAKIERPLAVKNFEKILKVSDGIMVARGDLGLEMPLEDLPLIQKKIVRRCVQEAKTVIVATQMLDSMIRFPMPTRAEVSDVANAILDGTDAIMLSGETATGKYPLKAVRVMAKIANEMENMEMKEHEKIEDELKVQDGETETVSFAAQELAEEVKAKLIICATTKGYTARSISKYRSQVPIVALTPSEIAKNQLALTWGVEPFYFPFDSTFVKLIEKLKKLLIKNKLAKKGDRIVVAAAHPFGFVGQTNLIKVEQV